MPYGYDKGHDALFKGYYAPRIADEVNKRLNSLVVGTAQIRDLAVTSAKIDSVSTDKLVAGEVLISPNLLDPDFTSGIVTRIEIVEGLIESEITSIDGRISALIQDLDGFSSYVGDQITGINTTIVQMNNAISSRVTDGQVRSIFLQEANSFTFQANQINFNGHVFGTGSTWSGNISTSQNIKVGNNLEIGENWTSGIKQIIFNNSSIISATADWITLETSYATIDAYDVTLGSSMYSTTTVLGSLYVNGTISGTVSNATNASQLGGYSASSYIRTNATATLNRLTVTDRIINMGTYNTTIADSANVRVVNNGFFARATSARRFKRDIEPLDEAYAENFFNNVTPAWFRSKSELDNPNYSYYGYVADDVAEVEPRLTTSNVDGEIDGMNYDRVPALLHVVMKKEKRRTDGIEDKVESLDNNVENLDDRVAYLERIILKEEGQYGK